MRDIRWPKRSLKMVRPCLNERRGAAGAAGASAVRAAAIAAPARAGWASVVNSLIVASLPVARANRGNSPIGCFRGQTKDLQEAIEGRHVSLSHSSSQTLAAPDVGPLGRATRI